MLREIDFQELKSLVESGSTFLLDIYASWCHPCRLLDRELEKVSADLPELEILRIDFDRDTGLTDYLGIGSLPYLILFISGKRAAKAKGFHRSDFILEEIRQAGL